MNHYRGYRQRGARPFTAAVLSLGAVLAWVFLRLDSPQWQRLLRNWRQYYPQLANKRPSLGDPLRGLVQTLWLLLLKPARPARGADLKRGRGVAWLRRLGRATFALVQGIRQPLVRLMRNLPRRIGHSDALAQTQRRIKASGSLGQRLFYWTLAVVGLLIALACITSPFNLYAQLVFVLTLGAMAMLMRYMPGRFPTLMMIILSITISCRYLWWRYTSTLHWANDLDLVLGMILLLAETYSWLVLIRSFVQSVWP